MKFKYSYIEKPEFIQLIFDGKTQTVKEIIEKKKSIVNKLFCCKYLSQNGKANDDEYPAYIFAIKSGHLDMAKLFIDQGANLNDLRYPSIFCAIREDNVDMIKLLVNHGAQLDFIDSVGKSAFEVAYYEGSYHLFPTLSELGLSVAKCGGNIIRLTAMHGNIEAARFFVKNGADINYHGKDMVFPNNDTAVGIASRHGFFEMVKWLCEHGADITLKDKFGDRPYTEAIKNKHSEIAEYLKNLEPANWHNEQNQIALFKKHKVPKELIDFFKAENLKIRFSDESEIDSIEFYQYSDVQETKFKRKSVLPLTVDIDKYSDVMLVWSGKEKAVCYIDTEHEEFATLCSWNEFIENAESYMNRIINGEFNS
jgi:uncharacterized protein